MGEYYGYKCTNEYGLFQGDIEYSTSTAVDKTDYFHIKDVISSSGQLVPAGEGDGMIGELLSRIKDDKTLTLEPHLAVFDAYKTIDSTEMKHKYIYKDSNEAFDAAVNALKDILYKLGYKEEGEGFTHE